jgi:hypothetical protein
MIISKYENLFTKMGIYFEKSFVVKDLNNVVINLTGYTIEAKFSNSILPSSTINSDMVYVTNLNANIINPTTGSIVISSDTSSFKFGRYMYQVNVIDSTNKKYRAFEGILTVDP